MCYLETPVFIMLHLHSPLKGAWKYEFYFVTAGIAALQKKAHYGGILSGIVAVAEQTADGEGILKTLAHQLDSLLKSSRASPALHDRCEISISLPCPVLLLILLLQHPTALTCLILGNADLVPRS